jgi:hypothetical protein
MTLNEKLNYISALESEGYTPDVVETLIEGIETPDTHYVNQKFTSGKALLDSIFNEDTSSVKG